MKTYRKRQSLEVGHVEDLNALHRVEDLLRVGGQFGDPLLEVEEFFGELGRLQTGGAQQLRGVFQKHFVGVDRLLLPPAPVSILFSNSFVWFFIISSSSLLLLLLLLLLLFKV